MNDAEALSQYAATRSGAAFAAIVKRHVDMVYSAVLRQTRDPHLAEDATQAVFIVLARKAGTIRDPALLPGWLIRTARYAAMNAIKLESRRRRHEQRAAAMAAQMISNEPVETSDVANVLDRQLARLGEVDRTAIVLRFFQGKSVREVSVNLGVSEEAAQKRIVRAIDKLRTFFIRDGIITREGSLEGILAAQPMHAAPVALLSAISAGSISTAGSASVIAKSVIHSMVWTPAKVAASVCIAAVTIVGGGTAVMQSQGVAHAEAPAAVAPVSATPPAAVAPVAAAPAGEDVALTPFANVMMGVLEPNDQNYSHAIDPAVKRTTEPAMLVQSTVNNTKGGGGAHFLYAAEKYKGKRIRISGWIKTQDLARWAGLDVNVFNSTGHVFAHDDMGGRPILGTTDWKRYESVVDVPQEAGQLVFGVNLYSAGKVWADGFQIEVVNADVPITDDQIWHTWSWNAAAYSLETDKTVQRNGHATTRFFSTPTWKPGNGGFYDRATRDVDRYLGKRVRMTAWLKGEGVTQPSGIHIHVNGASFKQLTNEGQRANRPIRGNMDWRQYEAIADVPAEAQAIFCGVTMNGAGKIWIDDVRMEVVEDGK